MILIGGRTCVFLYNYKDVAFARIPCMIYTTFSKMSYGVFTSFNLLISCLDLILQSYILILGDLQVAVKHEETTYCSNIS